MDDYIEFDKVLRLGLLSVLSIGLVIKSKKVPTLMTNEKKNSFLRYL